MKRGLLALVMSWLFVGAALPATAQSLELMAAFRQFERLRAEGKYAEAESFAREALELGRIELGTNHTTYANLLNNLALLYWAQGRFGEAEPLYKRALAIKEQALSPDHPDLATSLASLAVLYGSQGRFTEAEPLYKRALNIYEKKLGPDHPQVAALLNNLAELYRAQGRYGEAPPLYERSLAIYEEEFGSNHSQVATLLNNLALLYWAQGRYDEARPLFRRTLTIKEQAHGPDHPDVAVSLINLAETIRAQGSYGEAEPLYRRALAISESVLGPDHPHVAASLNNLAGLYEAQGRLNEAESLFERSLEIRERALGPDHPDVAVTLNNLAGIFRAQGRHDLTLAHIRRASAIPRGRAARIGGGRNTGGLSERRAVRYVFLRHLLATLETPTDEPSTRRALTGEGFESGQLANATGAAAAVARMAARFAAGDDALAALVREQQDATQDWRRLDAVLVKAASRPPDERDEAAEAALRQERSALDARIKGLDARLATAFPQFAELSSPRPLSLSEAQALLGEDEALLTYSVWDEVSFVFAVRRDRVLARKVALGAEQLDKAVKALRKGLDPTGVRSLADLPSFDTSSAFGLYKIIFEPLEPLLDGARHVFVVPDGALQSLPLGVLVTRENQGSVTDFAGNRQTQWLARKYAMTTLPSVSSLGSLRRFAKRAKASRPFLGIGDPKLRGKTGSNRGVALATLFTPRGVADVDAVRRLASLPETAGELRSLARTLGSGEAALLLGTQATETRVKQAALADHRVLAFATHGLVAGDLTGLSEPALVLTPPATADARDDGLLTASEVAQLQLDADWVILSACNTAAADGTPGAEGLSGLAKAFFYAGSRALLVSHWPVASEAAVGITTRMLEEAAKPGVGRAEAHRRAMLALIDDRDHPHFAHPLFWAPFVVVGEGGLAGN